MSEAELASLYRRDLEKLERSPDDASLWAVKRGIVNPAGTLTPHLVGNLP